MDINEIPESKTKDFPTGVSEHVYDTEGEVRAFTEGAYLADDIDVEVGEYFQRDGKFVVRARVGHWDDDDFDDEDFEEEDYDEEGKP